MTIPPPFQEVVKYCRERGFADPEGFADYYLENQKQGGWKRKDGSKWVEVKNVDLWKRLDELAASHNVEFSKIKGHSGHPENERCDELAVAEWHKFK